MKTLTTLSAVAMATFIFSSASAQDKTTSDAPKPVLMTAPAVKVQNDVHPKNSQNATAPKSTGTTTETKKATSEKSEPAPPVDNKIAVSDPGAPGDKAHTKKAATSQPTETKKAATSPVVSPK